jgi:hypothetical protein
VTGVRIESVEEPLRSHPDLAQDAATLVARGEVMGFLAPGAPTSVLGTDLLEALVAGLGEQGVALRDRPRTGPWTAQSIKAVLARALEQSEHSPMPNGEWRTLGAGLGEELLASLLGISESSVRRYASQARPTPQDVADRLHVLALIVADLSGGYNEYGIRRWFNRPRARLGGQTPRALLGKGWDPDGSEALRLRGLAASLVGAGGT